MCLEEKKEKKKKVTRPITPKSKLIQKHHRQESLSVKTPPRMGPTIEVIPNMLERHAMSMLRCLSRMA